MHWKNWTLQFVFFTGHNHMFSTRIKDLLCGINNLLKIPVFWRNAPETPRDRWHCAANAGLLACIAVLLWGKRSGYPSFITCRHFPGVANGGHQKPYLSRSSSWPGSHLSNLPGAGYIRTKRAPGYMRAESYGSQDKDHVGGFEQGFICRMLVFCTDGPCLQQK